MRKLNAILVLYFIWNKILVFSYTNIVILVLTQKDEISLLVYVSIDGGFERITTNHHNFNKNYIIEV
jgi:hypothetical protein